MACVLKVGKRQRRLQPIINYEFYTSWTSSVESYLSWMVLKVVCGYRSLHIRATAGLKSQWVLTLWQGWEKQECKKSKLAELNSCSRGPQVLTVCALEDFVWTTSNLCPWIRCLGAARTHSKCSQSTGLALLHVKVAQFVYSQTPS